jgi:hypothetical protein
MPTYLNGEQMEIHQDRVHTSVFALLPSPCTVLGLAKIRYPSGDFKENALVVTYQDEHGMRKSYFEATTGAYRGEWL